MMPLDGFQSEVSERLCICDRFIDRLLNYSPNASCLQKDLSICDVLCGAKVDVYLEKNHSFLNLVFY